MKQHTHLTIRPATETDQVAIRTLVRSERLNPHRLDWPNFVVAVDQRGLVGAVQLRKHWDGSRELGSLVVRKEARRQAIASKLIGSFMSIIALFKLRRIRRLVILDRDTSASLRSPVASVDARA